MHPLLLRQLRKTLPGTQPQEALADLLAAVSEAYRAADEDRQQLERSLHLASEELVQRNERLERELEERKRLELELRLAEKMRAVGQLAAGIAHEINTPVQFIGDSVYFLNEACRELLAVAVVNSSAPSDAASTDAPDLPFLREEIPRAISRCELGIDRVTKIVRALKELAHPDGAAQEPADLNLAIENTLIIAANEIKYVADVTLDLRAHREIRCHIGEIQQVLLNLIVNAAHAIAERHAGGGRGTVTIRTWEEGVDVLIVIADDGTGIPPQIRDRIFEPFFTTKPIGKGSGQGLSIARAFVVEHHGGTLQLDSELGRGTTFTIRLPIAGKPVGTAAAA
jgi:signal transduction histidine kinase